MNNYKNKPLPSKVIFCMYGRAVLCDNKKKSVLLIEEHQAGFFRGIYVV